MNKRSLLFILMISICCKSNEKFEAIKAAHVSVNGIYIEKEFIDETDPDRFTDDNHIFAVYRKFVYNYYILRHGDTLLMTAPVYVGVDHNPDQEWDFVRRKDNHPEKIRSVSLTVLPGVSNEHQTLLQYDYQFEYDPGFIPFSSTSGVIENKMNVWMLPHRDKFFRILELNPFPFIQQPFEVGHTWTWTLKIGDHWQDERWKNWSGAITNNYAYEIIGREKIETLLGELDCYVIEGVAESELGATGLISYFNEEYGFVKLDFINIDKSKLIMELSSAE